MSCYSFAYEQVLSRNILYRYRWPLALLIAIFCSVSIQKRVYNKEDFFGRIVLPIVVLFITLFVIKIISEIGLDVKEVDDKASKCHEIIKENFGLESPDYGVWNDPALSPNLVPFNPKFEAQPLQKKTDKDGLREVVSETSDEEI